MNITRRLLAVLSAFGIGTATIPSQAVAQDIQNTAEIQREAELQCRRALEENTIEALEEYLLNFPNAPSTCKVQALAALSGFSPDGTPGGDPSPDNGGYGG